MAGAKADNASTTGVFTPTAKAVSRAPSQNAEPARPNALQNKPLKGPRDINVSNGLGAERAAHPGKRARIPFRATHD